MSAFPPFPTNNRQQPPPTPEKKDDTALTDDETAFILGKYLTPTQRADTRVIKFITSYLECRNCAQASRAADVTYSQGSMMLRKPEVHGTIRAITEKALMKYGYDASEIVERVKEIAAIDPICFENPDGTYKTHMSQIEPEARRAIKKFRAKNIWGEDPNGMRVVIGQLIEVELWDKMRAIELLGREKDIFKETKRIEHDVTKNMAAVLLESKKRAEDRIEGAIDVTPQIEGKVEDSENE